jgi:hypothetical protein
MELGHDLLSESAVLKDAAIIDKITANLESPTLIADELGRAG